jgi:hypothetical protein
VSGLLLWALVQVAGAVEVRTEADGTVVVSALLGHDLAEVNRYLADPDATMRLGEDVRAVTVRPGPAGCIELTVVNKGFVRDLSYVAHRCPVPGGWRSKLVRSEDFDAHRIEWTATGERGGTLLVIRVYVEPKMPVPGFLIRKMVSRALRGTLEKLDKELAAGR